MHLLARTQSGLREELVVRDHSENLCIQGHLLRSIRFSLSLGFLVVLKATGQSSGLMGLRTMLRREFIHRFELSACGQCSGSL